MCKCKNYKSYCEYKTESLNHIGYFNDHISDNDCIHCHFISVFGNPNPSSTDFEKRVKQRYNVVCSCEHYYSYSSFLKKRKSNGAISAMMPLKNCYNCYLIKRYGTANL